MELDKIHAAKRAEKKVKGRGYNRSVSRRVDFGVKNFQPPSGKTPPLPFMIDAEWKAQYEAGLEQDEVPFVIAPADPDGFEADDESEVPDPSNGDI